MSTDIPSQADFQLAPERNYDLDGWHAWDTFGGLSLDQAYEVFRTSALDCQEDLMWMAPRPFCFYLPVALRYIQAADSSGDSDIVNCLAPAIQFQFGGKHDITDAFPCIRAICGYVLSHYSKFEVSEQVYGDLRPRYEGLLRRVSGEQAAAPNSRQPSQLPTSLEVQTPDSQRTHSSGGCG